MTRPETWIDSIPQDLITFDNLGGPLKTVRARMMLPKVVLSSGAKLKDVGVAFETYGSLNDSQSNVVVLCHALTGDHHVASPNPVTGKPGWWSRMVGPGLPIDTDQYFVICANILGGCMGTTGPKELNPETGVPYGLDFPVITIGDMVQVQALLLEAMGIDRVFSVIGGSMGGMQALEWLSSYGERVDSVVCIAAAARHSPQNIAFHEVGRQAIMADPSWQGGAYYDDDTGPRAGLSVARMTAHITYLSEPALQKKFGRKLQDRSALSFGFDADFQVESYLRHQGITFVDRFDANSYLYITRAMDYFDLAAEHGGKLADAFQKGAPRVAVISFSSDWLYPTSESRSIVHALSARAANVSFCEIESDKGHDAFLLDEPELDTTIRGFLDSVASQVTGGGA